MTGEVVRFPWHPMDLPSGEGRLAAERVLAAPLEERLENAAALHLEDPEMLLALCELLRERLETAPAMVREEAAFFYGFLETPLRKIGSFDERDYYLGELGMIAGTASRFLARREESRTWFDRAETSFALSQNSSAHVARLAYQRLALRLEERQFDAVMELAPRWHETFVRLGLPDDALKCRFLEAVALKETDRLAEAKSTLQEIGRSAEELKNQRLAAIAAENLFQIHAYLGESEAAIEQAGRAMPILKALNNRVGVAKMQLGVGHLLRSQRQLGPAVDAFRLAQKEFTELGMHADVAGTHLVLADLLLEVGQERQAEWEIRAALPVIDEWKLVPEGISALALVRESLRRRQIDRQALRNLHGLFRDA